MKVIARQKTVEKAIVQSARIMEKLAYRIQNPKSREFEEIARKRFRRASGINADLMDLVRKDESQRHKIIERKKE